MADTSGKVIKCRAAVVWEKGGKLSIEEVEVDPPKAKEVRIKIVANSLCHSDVSARAGDFVASNFPVILGHEAAGVVESIGEGVTHVVPGDHVIPAVMPQCRSCRACRNPRSNLCEKNGIQFAGFLQDGTSRFKCKGVKIHHFMGVSGFSQYTVISEWNVCKINKAAPLDKVCLLGCGVATGYGAAINNAQVTPGSSCAIWGLGGIGLSAIMGCKKLGASRIVGIDVNPSKFDLAMFCGATECINPKDHGKPITEVLKEITDGGLDFTFECVGSLATIQEAFDSLYGASGVAVIIGGTSPEDRVSMNPMDLLLGRTWKGSAVGGWKPQDDLPKLVEDYLGKKIFLDELVHLNKPLNLVEDAFEALKKGNVIRTVVHMT